MALRCHAVRVGSVAMAQRDASMMAAAGDASPAAPPQGEQEADPGARVLPPSASPLPAGAGTPDAARTTGGLPTAERAKRKWPMVGDLMDWPLRGGRTRILKTGQWLKYEDVYLRTSDHSLNRRRRLELAPDNAPTLCAPRQ